MEWGEARRACWGAQVALQIRSAQQKAALAGQAPPAWAIGAACHALSALHGDWREAVVKGISAAGNFVVAFTGQDDLEEARPGPLSSNLLCWPGAGCTTEAASLADVSPTPQLM